MLVLGIETTCDETAFAVVEDGKTILSSIIYSQAELHAQFGGVFPEMASREHAKKLLPTLIAALEEAKISPQEIDLIAVAKGPGLIGSLLLGITAAKALAYAWKKPLIGINHVEAHLYGAMLPLKDPTFPAIGLVISGGHTLLVEIEKIGSYTLIGQTVDDAIGECFDKVATLLDLPYPGGPKIELLAREGNPKAYKFSPGVVKANRWNFSFSGLKTNVLYTIQGQNQREAERRELSLQEKRDIAASFQEVALMNIVEKTVEAASIKEYKTIYIGGGVSCNQRLKQLFQKRSEGSGITLYWPNNHLALDNGAMIAGLGYHHFLLQETPSEEIEPSPRVPFYRVVSKEP